MAFYLSRPRITPRFQNLESHWQKFDSDFRPLLKPTRRAAHLEFIFNKKFKLNAFGKEFTEGNVQLHQQLTVHFD